MLEGVYGRPAMPLHREVASRLYLLVETLLEQHKIRTPPHQLRNGGLEAISGGIEDVRKGRVQGGKLVYTIG